MGHGVVLACVKVVFFDAVGTLIDPEPSPAEVYAAVGARHGCTLPVSLIRSRFRDAFQREETRDHATGWNVDEERERGRWRSIVGSVFEEHAAIEAIFRDLFEHFARPDAWRVVAGAERVLKELANRGLQLGVASNFDRRLHRIADELSPLGGIRHRIISSETGWRKPAPQFFDAVLRAARCAPPEIAFIGDRRDLDYDAASAAGMHAILFDNDSGEISDVCRIRHLTELI